MESAIEMIIRCTRIGSKADFVNEIEARDAAIRADEAAKCAERVLEAIGNLNPRERGVWLNLEHAVRSSLAITQGQSDPRDALIDAMRRYMAAYGPGYSSTDTGPYDALKKALEVTK